MQRLDHVAGVKLAQQAMAKIQIDSMSTLGTDEHERNRRRMRRIAVRHVLEYGTVYEPILEIYKGERA